MDWASIVEHLITFAIGGGLIAALTYRAANRKANAEADKTAAETETVEILQARAIIDMWQGLYKQLELRVVDLESSGRDKDQRIQELEDEVDDLRSWIESQNLTPPPRKRKVRQGYEK